MLEQGSIKSGAITIRVADALGNIINPEINSFNISGYDYISASYNDGTFTETYVFRTNGAGGTIVATITVIYVDATKEKLVSITKT